MTTVVMIVVMTVMMRLRHLAGYKESPLQNRDLMLEQHFPKMVIVMEPLEEPSITKIQ